jgi:prolipoprotein diacylglyceryltransferase
MADLIFVAVLGLMLGTLLVWGFRTLTHERWQVLATIPLYKSEDGLWKGLNITWYGLLSATAYVIASAVLFVLAGSIHVPPLLTLVITVLILAVAMPAARIVAILVEKKKHTFTVAGAFFVAVICAPPVLWLVNNTFGDAMGVQVPFLPVMATMAIAYTFGEGIGRLACISFGCCYGKPVADAHPLLRRAFSHWNFTFRGETKKIAYASGLQDVPVIPVQALTAVLYVITALVAVLLFLKSHYLLTFVLTMVTTQAWRFVSETLRADYRGGGKLSAYQIMSIAATVYALSIGFWLADVPVLEASITDGIGVLWHPGMLLFLQLLWIVSFIYTGKSSVTGSNLEIHLCHDKI